MELENRRIFVTDPKDVFELVWEEIQALSHEVIKLISLAPKTG
jgi:hypothetical protein